MPKVQNQAGYEEDKKGLTEKFRPFSPSFIERGSCFVRAGLHYFLAMSNPHNPVIKQQKTDAIMRIYDFEMHPETAPCPSCRHSRN
jgi:hypothetical protein